VAHHGTTSATANQYSVPVNGGCDDKHVLGKFRDRAFGKWTLRVLVYKGIIENVFKPCSKRRKDSSPHSVSLAQSMMWFLVPLLFASFAIASDSAFSATLPALPSPSHPPITDLNVSEGYLPFSHPSIPEALNARTWYRIATPVEGVNATTPKPKSQRPLVVLHGGPGLSHLYLRPTFDLFAQITDRTVIYYDQFGGGNSTRYPESKGNTTFWTPALFMEELDSVLLGLLRKGQEYDIYGHSWDAMFGSLYAATRQPKSLNKLILASAPAVMADWGIAERNFSMRSISASALSSRFSRPTRRGTI
jgi:hypothetical protein